MGRSGKKTKYSAKTLSAAVEAYFAGISRTAKATQKIDSGEKDEYGHVIWDQVPAMNDAAAEWHRRLATETNATFLPLYGCRSRYMVLKGGAGSGKSIFAGRYITDLCAREPGHRWLVCRKVARTIRESCFAQLVRQHDNPDGSERYPGCGLKVNKTDMALSYANGCQIIFAGLDDAEKLKSIYGITSGFVRIYAAPEAGAPYVIGGDTAGDGSDSFTAQVLDNRTGAQAAVLRHSFDEDVYARQVYCLGKHYNDALVAIPCKRNTACRRRM